MGGVLRKEAGSPKLWLNVFIFFFLHFSDGLCINIFLEEQQGNIISVFLYEWAQ